jgi:hypothetical protein
MISEAAIFSIGAVVFGITVWGVVMAGSVWIGGYADEPALEFLADDQQVSDSSDEPG